MTNLLKVLDISEDEQQMIWLIKKEVMVGAVLQCKGGSELPCPSESLADLAFRLRDEARKCSDEALAEAWAMIYHYDCPDKRNTDGDVYIWWIWNAKPIHWIIAALIAKDKNNE